LSVGSTVNWPLSPSKNPAPVPAVGLTFTATLPPLRKEAV
jgi:hypothetical protein